MLAQPTATTKQNTIPIPKSSAPANLGQAKALSLLQWNTASTKERQRGYLIDVHSDRWRSVVGGNYAEHLRALQSAEKIEINPSYSAGRFSRSYRIARAYRTWETEEYPLRRRLSNVQSRIRIDQGDLVGIELVKRFDSIIIPDDLRCEGWGHYNVRAMREGRYYASRCPYGRFHSAQTALPKIVRRRCTTKEGNPVVEVDIANSQPLILGIVNRQENRQGIGIPAHHPHPTTTATTLCRTLRDSDRYLQLCCEGKIYEHLTDAAINSGLTLFDFVEPRYRHRYTNRLPVRDDIKTGFLTLLFAKNSYMRRLPLYRIMDAEFPSVAQFIADAKSTINPDTGKEFHQLLAHRCQRFESAIMVGLGGVADRFMRERPDSPIITIHDAIACAEFDATFAKQIMQDAFAPFGVTPTVKITNPKRIEQ